MSIPPSWYESTIVLLEVAVHKYKPQEAILLHQKYSIKQLRKGKEQKIENIFEELKKYKSVQKFIVND